MERGEASRCEKGSEWQQARRKTPLGRARPAAGERWEWALQVADFHATEWAKEQAKKKE